MKNRKFDWLTFIAILFDCFFVWCNLGTMFDFYRIGNTNVAAIFGLGTILWTLLLWRDGENFNNKLNNKEDNSEND